MTKKQSVDTSHTMPSVDEEDVTVAVAPPPEPEPTEVGPPRCNNREQMGDGTMMLKLPTNRPLVFVQDQLPGFSRDDIWLWLKEGYDRWGEVCDLVATRIHNLSDASSNSVVQVVTVADLGGGGVLADQMLPYPNARRLTMRINVRIKWKATDGPMPSGTIDPIRTLEHETGHFMGHQHFPTGAPLELMEPYISQTIIRPQPTEAKVSAGWFGAPTAPIPPIPPTVPPTTPREAVLEAAIRSMIVTGTSALT